MEFRKHRLDNGLEIVAETNPDAYSMSVAFIVRTGSRDESDEVAGVSHFLEHMCFKGTPRRSADDVNREFDEIGAHYNAFTSEECTAYYASVLPEYQEPSVDILADILRPSLRPDDFNMEKKVILEEIQMYLDQPPFGMDDRIKQLHMGRHPLAKSVLGTSQSVGDLTAEQMRNYFDSRYSADNVFVVAAGTFENAIRGGASADGDAAVRVATCGCAVVGRCRPLCGQAACDNRGRRFGQPDVLGADGCRARRDRNSRA